MLNPIIFFFFFLFTLLILSEDEKIVYCSAYGRINLLEKKGKVKCTLVQALRLCTGRTAYRENTGIALPFHDHGTRRE
jgi:hypothetical protein